MSKCHPEEYNRMRLLGAVCLVSFVMHGIGLMLLFFVYRSYYVGVITIGKQTELSVVLLPLHKKTGLQPLPANVSTAPAASTAHNSLAMCTKASTVKKKDAKKSTKKIKNQPKKLEKISEKKNSTHKQKAPSSVAKQEKIVPTEKEIVKEEEKKVIHEVLPLSEQGENVHYEQQLLQVGQQEYDFLQMYRCIQEQIEHCWRPPSGFKSSHTCHIRVTIDWNGSIATMAIEKSSGILTYDISARTSLAAITFPRSAYGKEIIINFST